MATQASGNKLAGILGVSETAIRNAIQDGRIKRLPNGKIDRDEACAAWSTNTDPARSRVRTSPRTSAGVRNQGANPPAQVRTEAGAREAIGLIAPILAGDGIKDDGKGIDFGKIRQAEMILKAHQRHLDLAVERATMVDAANANAQFYNKAKELQTNLIAWAPRVAIEMAGELKVNPRTGKVDYRVLTMMHGKYVKTLLAEMGDTEEPSGRLPERRDHKDPRQDHPGQDYLDD